MTDETVERIVAAMKGEEYESGESSSAAPHAKRATAHHYTYPQAAGERGSRA